MIIGRFKFISKLVDSTASLSAGIALLGGMRPVMLANKLTTSYFTDGESYMELDIDVSSSAVAPASARWAQAAVAAAARRPPISLRWARCCESRSRVRTAGAGPKWGGRSLNA